jgi:nicotinate phosphoribosyltransferase
MTAKESKPTTEHVLLHRRGRKIMTAVRSILDNDLYKFSMGNAVLIRHPNIRVTYRFNDRRGKGKWTKKALKVLQRRISEMSAMALTPEERTYCETTLPWINRGFWDFLANYRYNPSEVRVWLDSKNNLQVEIKGLWCRTIFWEVPLLALISEVYYEEIDTNWNEDGQDEKMEGKAQRLAAAGVAWGDFGTRRRRHFAAQERVVLIGKKYANFTGTSNVHLAMKHGVKALGTMAHEWVMAHAALFSLKHANRFALEAWNDVYKGNLGTALPDTYGTDAFLCDFNGVLARLYDSVRHDSGDPYKWADKMVAHYVKLGIDWKAKPLGFTDGNTDESAIEIHNWYKEKGGRCWFGIGTSLSNDYGPDSPAVSIVIKLAEVEDTDGTIIHVVKLSDSPEKASGHPDAIRVAKFTHLGIPLDAQTSASTPLH